MVEGQSLNPSEDVSGADRLTLIWRCVGVLLILTGAVVVTAAYARSFSAIQLVDGISLIIVVALVADVAIILLAIFYAWQVRRAERTSVTSGRMQ